MGTFSGEAILQDFFFFFEIHFQLGFSVGSTLKGKEFAQEEQIPSLKGRRHFRFTRTLSSRARLFESNDVC